MTTNNDMAKSVARKMLGDLVKTEKKEEPRRAYQPRTWGDDPLNDRVDDLFRGNPDDLYTAAAQRRSPRPVSPMRQRAKPWYPDVAPKGRPWTKDDIDLTLPDFLRRDLASTLTRKGVSHEPDSGDRRGQFTEGELENLIDIIVRASGTVLEHHGIIWKTEGVKKVRQALGEVMRSHSLYRHRDGQYSLISVVKSESE